MDAHLIIQDGYICRGTRLDCAIEDELEGGAEGLVVLEKGVADQLQRDVLGRRARCKGDVGTRHGHVVHSWRGGATADGVGHDQGHALKGRSRRR